MTPNTFQDVDFGLLFITSADTETFKRSTYTILELLGDVGGLFGSLVAFGGLILSLIFSLVGDPVIKFLIESTYKTSTREEDKASIVTKMRDLANRKSLRFERKIFYCMRSGREKRMLRRGTAIINKELEIDHFLRT